MTVLESFRLLPIHLLPLLWLVEHQSRIDAKNKIICQKRLQHRYIERQFTSSVSCDLCSFAKLFPQFSLYLCLPHEIINLFASVLNNWGERRPLACQSFASPAVHHSRQWSTWENTVRAPVHTVMTKSISVTGFYRLLLFRRVNLKKCTKLHKPLQNKSMFLLIYHLPSSMSEKIHSIQRFQIHCQSYWGLVISWDNGIFQWRPKFP